MTPWTAAHQAPLSMEFSKREYWGRLPFLFPGHLPDPGIEPRSSALQEDSLLSESPGKLWCWMFVMAAVKDAIKMQRHLWAQKGHKIKGPLC